MISKLEVLGLEEIIQKKKEREYGVQVVSDKCFVMFLSKKDFTERILLPYPELRGTLLS